MKKLKTIEWYGLVLGAVFFIDRITKFIVLRLLDSEYKIAPFLSFDLVLNRGISWGMFHSTNEAMFYLITTVIIGVIVFLGSHTYTRWQGKHFIGGEVLVLAGACSNLVDRFLYRGVVDFIIMSWDAYVWPAFNVADIAIVVGVVVMLVSVYADNES